MDAVEHREYANSSDSDMMQKNHSFVDSSDFNSSKHHITLYSANANPVVPWMELDKKDILNRIWKHVNELNEMQHDIRKALKLEELDCLALRMGIPDMDFRETTPLVVEPKIYGREYEQAQIISKLMPSETDDGYLSVFTIVGNGGVGKTTLARLVYNDDIIAKKFLLKIWIYVSVHFDEVKLTHDLLECLYGNRFEGIEDLRKLQKYVEDGVESKRILLVMDDMWEDRDRSRWDTFLAPFQHNQVKGNKILVTTRKFSVVKMISPKDEIKLDGLTEENFWSLFKDYAFGNMRPQLKLAHIGRQITKKLKGYPLAAKTVGTLLSRKLDVEHWRRVLDSNEWIYQGSNDDIIPALRISYNHLSLPLQMCFSYCALFPKNYHFNADQLVNIWIAQGFICPKGRKRIEDVGQDYFNELMNCGFFQYEPTRLAYIMHDLIHDLAQMVSSDECFTIEALGSRAAPKFVRHISVITESAYRPEGDGSMAPNEAFKQEFVEVVGSFQPKNLGTVMLIGRYDSNFSEAFRHKVDDEFRAIRVLKLEMMFDGLGSLICNLAAFIHLRYLELRAAYATSNLQLPESLSKLYHLEVLDINIRHNWGSRMELPRGFSNLVNLRHFLAFENLHTRIAAVGKLILLQELKAFKVRKKKGFSIDELSTLMELRGSLKIYGLGNVETKEQAIMARLKDKIHLRNLHLSWEKGPENIVLHTAVLEGLQPHTTLKCLRIDGHRGAAPKWLTTDFSLTSLRSLHLEGCQNWVALPPIESLQSLRELHLVRLFKIREVIIGPLEVLELREMHRLTKCTVLNEEYSSKNIRVLEIRSCYRLNGLPFLQNSNGNRNEQRLPNLHRVLIHDWLQSEDLPALPVTRTSTDLDISNAGSIGSLSFRIKDADGSDGLTLIINGGPHLSSLDEKLLAFHNLTTLKEMEITGSPDLSYLAWKSLQQLTFLKRLTLSNCPKVFSSFQTGYILPPSLEYLDLSMCDITGSQLSEVLVSLTNLLSLTIAYCDKITSFTVGLLSNEINLISEGLCHIPLHSLTRMHKLHISSGMYFLSNNGLGELVSLKELVIKGCAELLNTMFRQAEIANNSIILPSSLLNLVIDYLPDKLLQYSSLTSLVQLDLEQSPSLTSLDLHSCTALQKLVIKHCDFLVSCKGFQSLTSLSTVIVMDCPRLVSLALQSCSALRHLHVEGCHALYTLESLVYLPLLAELHLIENQKLVSLKLHSNAALESLNIKKCPALSSWEHLKSLAHLVNLEIQNAPGFVTAWNHMAQEASITNQGLCLRLQTLCIDDLSFLTTTTCRNLVSLQKLCIKCTLDFVNVDCQMRGFSDEQQEALKLLNSLQRLELLSMSYLQMLPSELHRLSSLQHLIIRNCESIKSLPEKGLPASLKLLDVDQCSTELYEQCQHVRGLRWLYIRGRKHEKG
jgi:hypothetical protein